MSIKILQQIVEFELQGVIRYTYYYVMLNKENREPKILDFLKEQAQESLHHAQLVASMIVDLTEYEALEVIPNYQLDNYSTVEILTASYNYEKQAVEYYKSLLESVKNSNYPLEEFAFKMVKEEEKHSQELKEMINEYQF